MAWISVCLLTIGLYPTTGEHLHGLWTCSGLLGLVSAVGLSEAAKLEWHSYRDLIDSYIVNARTDKLTHLANRRAFEEVFETVLAVSITNEKPLALLMIDIDQFKNINDRLGYQAGDFVLHSIGELLKNAVRQTDFVARCGGEEFVVILPETNADEAGIVGDRIRKNIRTWSFQCQEESIQVTVSIGIAGRSGEDNAESLYLRADSALDTAKQSGHDRIYCLSHSETDNSPVV